MADRAGKSLGNNLNVDIDFGEKPQLAVAARGQTSSQLQVFSSDKIVLSVDLEFQAPRPYRPGYSESEGTSDDSCYRPRLPSSFRLPSSPHPEVNDMHLAHHPIQFPDTQFLNNQALFQVFSEASSRPSSRPSRPSLAWDNYDSGPHFQPPTAINHYHY